jgi:hypothetical protein
MQYEMKPRQVSLDDIPMLLSGVILSLGAPGFGGKHSRSGIFEIGDGGTDFERGGTSSLWGGGVCSGPVLPGVACDDRAGIGVFSDGIFGGVIGIFVCVSCTAISGDLEINNAPASAIAFSAVLRSAFFRRILSTVGK